MFKYDVPHEHGEFSQMYSKNYKSNPLVVSAVRFFDRYLLQKAMSVFKWTIPENWDLNYFLYNLYIHGFIAVTDYDSFGVIPQACTISGFNIYYNPSKCIIANPYLPYKKEISIGSTGELVQLTPDYCGILDIVNSYSEMLANALCAVNTGFYNSRLAYIFYANNQTQAQSFKKMYDSIGTGVPAVFVDSKLMRETPSGELVEPFEPFNANLKNNYIVTEILEDMRRIEHAFAQKIGLPNTNTEKKAQMAIDEVNKSDIETQSNIALWHDTLTISIERVKALYPNLNLNFDWRYNMKDLVLSSEGGTENDLE